jgi:hypothetical protein
MNTLRMDIQHLNLDGENETTHKAQGYNALHHNLTLSEGVGYTCCRL